MSGLQELRADMAAATDQFGRIAVVLLRLSRSLGPLGVIPDVLMRVVCGCEIPRAVAVGPGVRLVHGGRGVVVHHSARVGSDVTIHHGVTLGASGPDQGAPTVGDRVYIGTGACILGDVVVGDGAKIGANAVVLTDVPAGATAVGVPARIIPASGQVSSQDVGRGSASTAQGH
jgi:serine O-acetyltransferase